MPTLINKKQIIDETWVIHQPDDVLKLITAEPKQLVQALVTDWEAFSSSPLMTDSALKLPENLQLGIQIPNTLDPELLLPILKHLTLIAIEFPLFTDGRGYSQARMLRELGFRGQIRATGDVLPDQLFYMARCGIDTFALKDGKSPTTAFDCLKAFSAAYQAAADEFKPIYR